MATRRATGGVQTKQRTPTRAQRRRGERRRIGWIRPVVIAAAIVAVAGVGVVIQSQRASTPRAAARPALSGPEGSEVIGPASASVLVEEYGDYQCPACGRFDREIAPRIRELVAAGRIRFAYHPIAFLGPESIVAANAAVCAADQGKFWDLHDYLFSHQSPENSGALTTDRLIEFGAASGASGGEFSACVRDIRYEQWLRGTTDRAFTAGVHSTPTVLVNGQPLDDPFQAVAAIESALGQAG